MLINIIAKVNGKKLFSLIDIPCHKHFLFALFYILCFALLFSAFQPWVKFMYVMFIATLLFLI